MCCPRKLRSVRRGFTLVELLVVVTIIALLIGLLLPAVNGAREAGRRATCASHLKQLAYGCLHHEAAQDMFPTGGWEWYWAGDPDRGWGWRQPGGWTYNILPYIEQQALHDLGSGQNIAGKMAAFAQRGQVIQPLFYCPTRRKAIAYPNPTYMDCNANPIYVAARTDYAANAGTNQNMFWVRASDQRPLVLRCARLPAAEV